MHIKIKSTRVLSTNSLWDIVLGIVREARGKAAEPKGFSI